MKAKRANSILNSEQLLNELTPRLSPSIHIYSFSNQNPPPDDFKKHEHTAEHPTSYCVILESHNAMLL